MQTVPRVGDIDADDALDVSVRVGLVSYGIVHLVMAWLALQMAFGDRAGKVSGSGAFQQLAGNDLGRISLFVFAGGLGALVVWQVAEALVGHRDEDGAQRLGKRLLSAGRAVVFAVVGYAALQTALGGGSGGSSTDSMTGRLMSQPFGPWLVGLVGVVIFGIAVGYAWTGLSERFLKKLRSGGRGRKESNAYRWFGKVGYLAKAVAFAVVAWFFVYAALTHDADKSAGLDKALLEVLRQPFGPILLGLIAVGIAAYGLFCFAWARHVDR